MRRTLVALAVIGLLTASLPAGAASRGDLRLKDAKGDANGINSQDLGLPLPSTITDPASVAGADIVGIDVTTVYKTVGKKRVAKGTSVAMHLAGPVMSGVNYLLTARLSATCDGSSKVIQLGYQDLNKAQLSLADCQAATTGGTAESIGFASVSGSTITWTLDAVLKPGGTFTNFYASTSVFVVGVFDESLATGTYTYAK